MNITKFLAVDGVLYKAEDISFNGGGCQGCSFNALPSHNEVCDTADCHGIIFKEAGLGGVLEVIAMANKEEQ